MDFVLDIDFGAAEMRVLAALQEEIVEAHLAQKYRDVSDADLLAARSARKAVSYAYFYSTPTNCFNADVVTFYEMTRELLRRQRAKLPKPPADQTATGRTVQESPAPREGA